MCIVANTLLRNKHMISVLFSYYLGVFIRYFLFLVLLLIVFRSSKCCYVSAIQPCISPNFCYILTQEKAKNSPIQQSLILFLGMLLLSCCDMSLPFEMILYRIFWNSCRLFKSSTICRITRAPGSPRSPLLSARHSFIFDKTKDTEYI